jgi:phage terminase large subunit-like protein
MSEEKLDLIYEQFVTVKNLLTTSDKLIDEHTCKKLFQALDTIQFDLIRLRQDSVSIRIAEHEIETRFFQVERKVGLAA